MVDKSNLAYKYQEVEQEIDYTFLPEKIKYTSVSLLEVFNNKVGWLTRQAYGYRDEEYLILKIYDLPNLKIAKEL